MIFIWLLSISLINNCITDLFTANKHSISPDEEILPQHDLKHSESKYFGLATYEQLPHQQKCVLREQH